MMPLQSSAYADRIAGSSVDRAYHILERHHKERAMAGARREAARQDERKIMLSLAELGKSFAPGAAASSSGGQPQEAMQAVQDAVGKDRKRSQQRHNFLVGCLHNGNSCALGLLIITAFRPLLRSRCVKIGAGY